VVIDHKRKNIFAGGRLKPAVNKNPFSLATGLRRQPAKMFFFYDGYTIPAARENTDQVYKKKRRTERTLRPPPPPSKLHPPKHEHHKNLNH
jgi:hypothetical protein